MEIGDKVICVDAGKQPHTAEELNNDMPNWVVKGRIYTIRDIVDSDFVVGVRLEELHNPSRYFRLVERSMEGCFATWRFRKQEQVTKEVESYEYSEQF